MNRRNFIRGLITAAAGFTILPGAGRIWKAEAKVVPVEAWECIPNPAWVNAPYELHFLVSDKAYLSNVYPTPQEPPPGGYTVGTPPLRFKDVPEVLNSDTLLAQAIPPYVYHRKH